jgi:hypothetical protein
MFIVMPGIFTLLMPGNKQEWNPTLALKSPGRQG